MSHFSKATITIGFFLLLQLFVSGVFSDCGCDHTIEEGAFFINGEELGIKPGDVVCIMSGSYRALRFRAINGVQNNPVVIKNCGGQVLVSNDELGYAVVFEWSSSFFHFTGTGDSSFEYGFEIIANKTGGGAMGVSLTDLSTNYEVDHLEIHHTAFAGLMAKTDPKCDGSADQDKFVQRDIEIHHLYVHHTEGEGFYIGSTQTNGQKITCDGVEEVHYPHFLEGVNVHSNILSQTGWDGAQVGFAKSDCKVWNNTIFDVGSGGVKYQQQGLQIGSYSACEVYNNVITNGPACGIIVIESGESTFYNNLIANVDIGVFADHRGRVPNAGYGFFFNTIVNYTTHGLRLWGDEHTNSKAISNIIVGPEIQLYPEESNEQWTISNNLLYETAPEGLFVSENDLMLGDDSPARGAGLRRQGIEIDLNWEKRPNPPAAGVYEHPDDWIVDDDDDDIVSSHSRLDVQILTSSLLLLLIAIIML
ncbi:hypothetical protein M0812_20027 [Anaeramoeba flamelloides]|uniref:Right handed beta helix domain-containing protein n=1 Tax=Anaeramoeba flamelloides TaxID=1746091 RepID=A0AAV7YYS3_9EUKA|nr:hypothetical protein M0812_20027 [Anaeramoeba flamelloides]|eukprot:Anaeramoba_flamelloidesa342052_112.p1 GENE.a342052_112~~a342052_112.p1  ORF type:complete len:476 (-),score=100.03 a342052_112:113-1540(-)